MFSLQNLEQETSKWPFGPRIKSSSATISPTT